MVDAVRAETFAQPGSSDGAGSSGYADMAADLIDQNRDPVLDAEGLRRDVALYQKAVPAHAAEIEQAVLAQLSPREQGEFTRPIETAGSPPAAANDPGPGTAETVADLAQLTLDLIGIVEPTPFADGSNAVISVGRSIGSLFSGEPGEALGHLGNGVLSGISILPYLGDSAKIAKIGNWAETVADAVSLAARSDAARAVLDAPLREIQGLVNRIPQGAIDAMPSSAREAFERMKTQLDDFVAGGARSADEVAQAGSRMVGNTLVIDANRGATFTAGGRTQAIGEAPAIANRADGRQVVTDVNGDTHLVRRPGASNYDSRTVGADGSVTYTRDGRSVTYDQSGFPVFEAQADLYLSPAAINSSDSAAHFREANQLVGDALRADPGLAQRMGLNDEQVTFLTRDTPSDRSPPDLTWHHHQDTGRIQLVDRDTHAHFSGGHTGGMRIWGGGR